MNIIVSLIFNTLLLVFMQCRHYNVTATNIHNFSSVRSGRASLISFQTLGKDVAVGLDFEMPFIQVPKNNNNKDKSGNSPARVNINTASVITTGLMVGGSMLVAQLIRLLSPFQEHSIEDDKNVKQENTNNDEMQTKISIEERKGRLADEDSFLNDIKYIVEHAKLVYKNDSDNRVETTLPHLLSHIEDTFLNDEIDIRACVKKSICLMLHESSQSVRYGKATSLQKIIDGISSSSWLLDVLAPYEDLKRAIKSSKMNSDKNCILAYPTCKSSAPATELIEFIGSHMNFI